MRAKKYPHSAAPKPMMIPTVIIEPIPTPRRCATSAGPGAGGTSECVIVPPAMMHKM